MTFFRAWGEGLSEDKWFYRVHIYTTCAKYTYEQSKEFAKDVKLVHQELPKFTSIERIVSEAEKCIWIFTEQSAGSSFCPIFIASKARSNSEYAIALG
jgi:hypothetical protein